MIFKLLSIFGTYYNPVGGAIALPPTIVAQYDFTAGLLHVSTVGVPGGVVGQKSKNE